jgi:hypothetical protein
MVMHQQPPPQFRQQPTGGYQRPMQQPRGQQFASGDRYLPAMPEMLQGGQSQPYQPAPTQQRPAQQQQPQQQPRYAQQPQPQPRQPRPQGGNGTYLPAMPEMMQVASQEYKSQAPGMVVRGARPDTTITPTPTRTAVQTLDMPSPDQLGLGKPETKPEPAPRSIDWNTTRERLEALGATQYRLEKLGVKQYRFVCAVPHPRNATLQQQFDITAAAEGEAMMQTLEAVQKWIDSQP